MSLELDGAISIAVEGQILVGWQAVRITRGIEHFPSDFEIITTEKYPGSNANIVIRAGTPCTVSIGGDVVITGYVDEYDNTISPHEHTVRISGRSKCEDLLDCSAFFGDFAGYKKGSALEIIKDICAQYDIEVEDDTDGLAEGEELPFMMNRGESPLEIIDRLARWHGFLYHDLPDGNLKLTIAGEDGMGSGLLMGGDEANVQLANYRWNTANVMSDYYVWISSNQQLQDLGPMPEAAHVEDNYMVSLDRPRRYLYILSEQVINPDNFALLRANWEANHREGTGQTITATVDRWRDADGMLWSPNFNIPVNMPQLKIQTIAGEWVISSVTFLKDNAGGQTAQLVLNPAYTFNPQPENVVPAGIADIAP